MYFVSLYPWGRTVEKLNDHSPRYGIVAQTQSAMFNCSFENKAMMQRSTVNTSNLQTFKHGGRVARASLLTQPHEKMRLMVNECWTTQAHHHHLMHVGQCAFDVSNPHYAVNLSIRPGLLYQMWCRLSSTIG